MREIIEREVAAAKHAVETLLAWIPHRTTVMKLHEFDRPLDDLGQSLDEAELAGSEPAPPARPRGA